MLIRDACGILLEFGRRRVSSMIDGECGFEVFRTMVYYISLS